MGQSQRLGESNPHVFIYKEANGTEADYTRIFRDRNPDGSHTCAALRLLKVVLRK